MAEEYTEEMFEAVKENFGYLEGINHQEVATFLECVADSMYDGDWLHSFASALRDVGDEEA